VDLDDSSFVRNNAGQLDAVTHIALDADSDVSPAEPLGALPEMSATKMLPTNLRVTTVPPAASVWLFVGKTPEVRIPNVDTRKEQQLRISRPGHTPTFQVLSHEHFDLQGVARIDLKIEDTAVADGTTPEASAPRFGKPH
jgi:hypothetical protein